MTDKIEYGYMCKIDYDWELGCALGGSKIYPNKEDLIKHHNCAETCGIVKVKVLLEEVVSEGKRFGTD